MANNIVLLPAGGDAADQLVLTAVATSITWAPTQYGQQGSAVYTGTITNGAANALRGTPFTVAGFVGPNNNGTFLCESSTATTLTLSNARATAETHAAVANYGTQGFPFSWATKIENMYSNNQGDNISIETNGGETLVAIAMGLRSFDPFDLEHGTAPYLVGGSDPLNYIPFGFTQGLNDFNANPVITDDSLGTPATVTAVNIANHAYTVTAATFTAATPFNPVNGQLGAAAEYAVLAYSGITSASPSITVAGGNIGSSSTPATSTNFVFTSPAAIDNTNATAARTAGEAAYVYYTSLPFTTLSASSVDLSISGTGGSNSYVPGNYKAGTSMTMSTGIVFSAPGLYVFWAGSTVDQPSSVNMSYSGSASASNVFVVWCVGSSFSQSGVAGVTIGTILAYASITFAGHANLQGRALAVGLGDGDVTFAASGTVTAPGTGSGSPASWALTGTFTGGATNAFAGYDFTVGGFTHAGNNGVFVATASSATSLTLTNLDGVSETHAATASIYILTVTAANAFSVGQQVELTGMYEPWLDDFIGKIITESGTNFTVFYPEGTEPYNNPAEPACGELARTGVYYCPLATPLGVNVWTLVANINLVDSDYIAAIPPAAPFANTTPYPDYTPIALPGGGRLYIQIPPAYVYNAANQWQSSKWNLDGYYPSVYIWVATAVAAGTYNVNLNSVYQNGVVAPQDLAAGKAIYDGGVNFQVLKFQGVSVPEVSFSIGTSTTNPATAPAPIATTSNADGGALISVGLMKSGNVFAAGATGATPISLVLSAVTPLLYGPYSAPIREGGAVYTGTITGGANNAFVGYVFTVTGFLDGVTGSNPNGFNNGVFTCTASTATTLILTNGAAVIESHAGAAAYTPPMTQITTGALVGSEAHYMVEYSLVAGNGASYNPGFQNPLGYEMVVASIAIKST